MDVVLQKDRLIYAVKVGITTSKDWECHNIEKCLADGYENVIALSEDEKGASVMLGKLNEHGLLPHHQDKVKVYDLVQFMGLLDKESTQRTKTSNTIKGYSIKVEYKDST